MLSILEGKVALTEEEMGTLVERISARVVEELSAKLADISSRLESLEAQLKRGNSHLEKLQQRTERVEQLLGELREDTRHTHELIRLQNMRFANIEDRLEKMPEAIMNEIRTRLLPTPSQDL